MSSEDVNYYERRAEAEIELACRSLTTEAVQAHYQLANAYLEKIYGGEEAAAAE